MRGLFGQHPVQRDLQHPEMASITTSIPIPFKTCLIILSTKLKLADGKSVSHIFIHN